MSKRELMAAISKLEKVSLIHLTRFNKIAIQGKRPRWQVDKEAVGVTAEFKKLSSMCVCMRYLSILFLNIFTLLVFTQSENNLFHSFLCENEYFLISNLH